VAAPAMAPQRIKINPSKKDHRKNFLKKPFFFRLALFFKISDVLFCFDIIQVPLIAEKIV
jgi:hypothetical protein